MTLRPLIILLIIGLGGSAFAAPSAEELFDQGQRSFASGAYADAVSKWNESYGLSNEPELLFNIAQALRLDGRCAQALATYRRFVTSAPSSEQRPLADEFVRELTAKCGVVKTAPTGNQSTKRIERPHQDHDVIADHNETPRVSLKIGGLVVAGAGAVSVVTGLYFGHRASSLGQEVTNACRSGCDWAVYGDKDADGRGAVTKQYVFVGIGVAAVIGGGVMYWLASREQRAAPIAVVPAHDGAAITWSGSW